MCPSRAFSACSVAPLELLGRGEKGVEELWRQLEGRRRVFSIVDGLVDLLMALSVCGGCRGHSLLTLLTSVLPAQLKLSVVIVGVVSP